MVNTERAVSKIDIILATSIPEEKDKLLDLPMGEDYPFEIHCPESLIELDQLTTSHDIKLIITDLAYKNGSLVDWLTLWPYPFILLVNNEDEDRIDHLLGDESSSFLLRREDLKHVKYLPSLMKKVLNTRESLERHNNFLKISERQYMNLVQALPDIIYVLDREGNFTFINNSVRMLGWEPQELIGRHFTELLFPDDIPRVSRKAILPPLRGKVTGEDRSPKLFDERRTGSRMTRGLSLKLRRKPGVGGALNVSLTAYGEISSIGYTGFQPLEDDECGTAGIIRENNRISSTAISEHDAESIFTGKGALSHDEVMHLINNKLQVLSSLVSLKQGVCEDCLSSAALNEVQIQIYTLSLIYQNMVKVDNKVKIRMQSYIDDIIKHLTSSYAGNPLLQQIQIHSESVYLDEDTAITISLLINELLTIILKLQEHIDEAIVPTIITFLINEGIAQLKIRTTERIAAEYKKLSQDDNSEIVVKTLAEIIGGEIFTDTDSLSLFFNLD